MRRRDVITLAGGAAAMWLQRVHAQGTMPVVGFLNGGFADSYAALAAAFLKGLGETGYVDGRNVAIEFR
jgi:putative ABC transport system substrate-binding protein